MSVPQATFSEGEPGRARVPPTRQISSKLGFWSVFHVSDVLAPTEPPRWANMAPKTGQQGPKMGQGGSKKHDFSLVAA